MLRFISASLAAVCAAAVFAQDPTVAEIDRFGNQFLQEPNAVGVAVGVIKDGKVYDRFFGTVRKGEDVKPDGKTLFQLASVTKSFTAALLAKSVQDGVVQLNDPVVKYLPAGTQMPGGAPITLLDLATHSSGLPRLPRVTGRSTSYEEVFQQLPTYRLAFEPGDGYLYSNLAFGLLGFALARANAAPNWQELVKQRIMAPLGMVDTTVFLTPDQKARVASGYSKNGELSHWTNPAFPAVNPAGALYSDMDDMMKYLDWMMGSGPSELNGLREIMLQPYKPMKKPSMKQGLAWALTRMPDGRTFVDKDGALQAFVSYICWIKEAHVGVVVLANSRCKIQGPARQLIAQLAKSGQAPDSEDSGEDPN